MSAIPRPKRVAGTSYVIMPPFDKYARRYLITVEGRIIESTNSRHHAIRVAQQSADWYHGFGIEHTRTVVENLGSAFRTVYRSRYARRHRGNCNA